MLVRTVRSRTDRALQARRAVFGPLTRLLNAPIRRLAGRSGVPLLGLVSHQGRRSGRTYLTPVGVGSTGTAFLIPLTFGFTSDWCRNVLSAGSCAITWRGARYMADQPEVVDAVAARAEVNAAFGPLQRRAFRMLGLHQFLRLRRLDGQPARDARSALSPAGWRAAARRAALFVLGHGLNPLTIALARRPWSTVATEWANLIRLGWTAKRQLLDGPPNSPVTSSEPSGSGSRP